MDSIVSKVRVELVDLAATYAADKHENRALFTILDEGIRIKDLEQSKELRDEMMYLFEDEYPTKPAWPKTALDIASASTEHLIGGEPGNIMLENKKLDETNTERRLLGTGGLDNEKPPKPVVKDAVSMANPSEDFYYSWANDFHYNTDGSSSDGSELDDDVVNGEEKNWENADIGR
ncbi:hypothetical protein COCVIDRAFT_40751 [Bipolaris victoriae FI3]|uniref:Uncharacterized protein n=1 Tax=Bipolaris victoriae (strain FI3) TaxID=930091 RepID=W7E013_BIPV3|nr:hypothetical protein COCVIDRAFT_40751 [Bipolaris victoriae FI3]